MFGTDRQNQLVGTLEIRGESHPALSVPVVEEALIVQRISGWIVRAATRYCKKVKRVRLCDQVTGLIPDGDGAVARATTDQFDEVVWTDSAHGVRSHGLAVG